MCHRQAFDIYMNKILLLVIFIFHLTSCVDNNKAPGKLITKEKRKDSVKQNLWGSIDVRYWDTTPSINGRVATEQDIKNGLAVYSVENNGFQYKVYETQLPKLAYYVDPDTKKEKLVVVIQIEITSQGTIAGYRNLGGGNGICLLNELKFLNKKEINQITRH